MAKLNYLFKPTSIRQKVNTILVNTKRVNIVIQGQYVLDWDITDGDSYRVFQK